MPASAAIYKCFIASPSDTQDERNACSRVIEGINKNIGQKLGFRIETKKWEEDTHPGFDTDGQDVINKQILSDYEILIGIMWNKFGTTTARAGSGTEEEFNHALEKVKSKDGTEIMFYFNTCATKSDSLDLEQVKKVRDFKIRIAELGGLYFNFDGVVDFEKCLTNHLQMYFLNKYNSGKNKTQDLFIKNRDAVTQILKNKLNESLSTFSNQPIFWVDPVLSETNEISRNESDKKICEFDLSKLIEKPESTIIKAPPQFGLTCLARHLAYKAWEIKGEIWIYIDSKKSHKDAIPKFAERELKSLDLPGHQISCIIVDSWNASDFGAKKFLKTVCQSYKGMPIILMETIDNSKFLKSVSTSSDEEEIIDTQFKVLHLLALPRAKIRKVVSTYNNEIRIGEEDAVLAKVIKDLSGLNIHRTPLNCITLLKVCEKYFDESPVNRTKMIEMVLFVLFDLGEIPTYKVRPDVKDCEHVLGIFCEGLIKEGKNSFTREIFIGVISEYIDKKLFLLDIEILFDILFSNHIIIKNENEFEFKAAYWIFYFSAKRMYLDKEFYNYIIHEKLYISFPELIEFYAGIDRNRDDVLEILIKEINSTCSIVEKKTGLPADVNPLKFAHWSPDGESLEKMKKDLSEDVLSSNLPDSIKDQYADRNYNQLQPYDQNLNIIFHDYSLVVLMQNISACSRALRNSDYATTEIKQRMLKEILSGWKQVSKILFALAPALATRRKVVFEGQGFILRGEQAETVEDRILEIFEMNTYNIVNMFKDDLFSNKMAPLIYDGINGEKDELTKHQLILLIIFERPPHWRNAVENYIISLQKNSFYLYDVYVTLRAMYSYSFATVKEIGEMSFLIKMGIAKHELGETKPSFKSIGRVKESILPDRDDSITKP